MLYEQRIIGLTTEDKKIDELHLDCTDALREGSATAIRELVLSKSTPSDASIGSLLDSDQSFCVYEVDASSAIDDLRSESLAFLKRIPLLIRFKTGQFKKILQYHDPSDERYSGQSATYFIDRQEEPDGITFRMGGYSMLVFEEFNTVGNTPELMPGNEIISTHTNHFDTSYTAENIRQQLIELGFEFADQ